MADDTRRWGDRTVAVPPQDPWATPAAPGPASAAPGSAPGETGRPQPETAPRPAETARPPAGVPTDEFGRPFQRGVAPVRPVPPRRDTATDTAVAPHLPTGTGWPDDAGTQVRRPLGWHLRQLRSGGGTSTAALLFAFVCWGIWAVSTGGDLTTSVILFVLIVAVAVGLFALARLVGRVVLERQFGRVRRTARGAHLCAAVFLAGVGLAYLRQTPWVMDAWRWLAGFA